MSGWIAETLLATTLLMIAVLALRGPVARLFGARIAYLLWLAPALRMVLPPLPDRWFAAAAPAMAPSFTGAETMIVGAASPAPVIATAPHAGVAWLSLSLTVWLGGALLFFAWHWLSYQRFVRRALDDADHLGGDVPVPVIASSAVGSPVALGIFGRRVVVPADFQHRYDAVEQRLALDHEFAHHRRFDLPANLAALTMLALHWFNPVAHIAHRAFRIDQEAACDAMVLRLASRSERHAYGTALFKSATGGVPLAVCALGAAATLKSRLRQIARGETSPFAIRTGALFAVALVLAGLGLTATRTIAQPDVDRDDGKGTIIRGDAVIYQDPAQAKPATAAAKAAEAHAQAAERAADAAQDLAEAARERAEAIRERAEAAREKAGDEATEQAIASAEQAAEAAHAAAAQAHARAADAAARAETAAEADADAAADAVDGKDERAMTVACEKAVSRQIVSQNQNGRRLVVIQCDQAISAYTNARTRQALTQARAQVAAISELSEAQKALTLKRLDSAIERLQRATPAAPRPPAPPHRFSPMQ